MKRSLKSELNSKAESAKPEGGLSKAELGDIVNEYSGMSENELMRELIAKTNKQKAEGRFDASSVEKGVNALLPMLNEDQKRKLYSILDRL